MKKIIPELNDTAKENSFKNLLHIQVQQLRLQLLQTNGTVTPAEIVKDTPRTREQVRKLETENRQLLQEMQKLVDSNTEMCEKVISLFLENVLQTILACWSFIG